MSVFIEPAVKPRAARDISIDYLRAVATVLVLVAHACLPYTHGAQVLRGAGWHTPVPVLDTQVSLACDYVFSILDASVIALWFFLSGLFTYPALTKKGIAAFLRERLMRLGVPYLLMTVLLMPLAYYAAWGVQHPAGSFLLFLREDAHLRFFNGPGWFLWLLLVFDGFIALLYVVLGKHVPRLVPVVRRAGSSPAWAAAAMLLAGAVLYVPLALRYGSMWLPFVTLPFLLQPARTLFYAAWLLAGFLAGCTGLKEGLLGKQSPLAMHWKRWTIVGLLAVNASWLGLHSASVAALSPHLRDATRAMLWVVTNVGVCFGLLAFFRGRVWVSQTWAASLARHAYGIYLCHYVFAMWSERWLLHAALPAIVKSVLAFVFTLTMSWLAVLLWSATWRKGLRLFSRGRQAEPMTQPALRRLAS